MAIKTVNDIPSDIKSFVERYYCGETSLALDQARQLRLEKNDIADLVDIATDILQSPPDSLFSFYDLFIERASNVDMLLNISGFNFDDMDELSLSELSEEVPENVEVPPETDGNDPFWGNDLDLDEAIDFSFSGFKSNQPGVEEARDVMEDSLSGCQKDRKSLNLMGNSIELSIDLDESFRDLNSSCGPVREADPNQYSGLIRRGNLPEGASASICHAGTPSQPLAALYAVAAEADIQESAETAANVPKLDECGSITYGRFGGEPGQNGRLSTASSLKAVKREEPLVSNEPYSVRALISMNKPLERIQGSPSGVFSRPSEELASSKPGTGGRGHLHFDKRGSGMFSIDAVAQDDMSLGGSIRHSRSIRESLTENERPTMTRLHAVGGLEHERPTVMSLKPAVRTKAEDVPSADVTVAPPKKQRTRTPTMETDELSTLHPLSRTPRLCVSFQELSKRTDIDARAGFILSLIDGTVTIGDILSISSWSQTETASILLNLKSQNILDFE